MDIDKIVACLNAGGVALLPTDTVYGLAVKAGDKGIAQKIFDLKMRPGSVNLPIMVASSDDLISFGADLHPAAMRLFKSDFVPGDLTLVLGFAPEPKLPWLAGREEFAVRIPDSELMLDVLKRTGPLLVTSANKHGVPQTPNNVADILAQLNGEPDIVVDGGLVENVPSTIVNCRKKPPVIERVGRINEDELFNVLNDE